MKKKVQNICLLTLYTVLFSALIFVGKDVFFSDNFQEEIFLEPSLDQNSPTLKEWSEYYSFSGVTKQQIDSAVLDVVYTSYVEKYEREQAQKLRLRYIPTSFQYDIAKTYTPIAETFLYKRDILSQVEDLGVYFYRNIADTRGRMKGKNIHMFGVEQMTDEEFLWVLIHEFAHYFDIHSLERSASGDVSQEFYDVSWQSVSIIRAGQLSTDFVSGYAMTNQYEDFAESYLYYILHNAEFLSRAADSRALAEKYFFFQNYIFPNKQFYNKDFGWDRIASDYYWDITKIPVDVKNFLQYFQDAI